MSDFEKESAVPAVDARAQPRSSIFLAAVIRAGPEQAPVKVRNLSPNGAMIESPLAPSVGTTADLIRGALIARGTVIWSMANRFGLRFASEVSVKDWLAAPSKVQQQRVDEIVALVKAGSSDPGRNDSQVDEARSQSQLVDDLGAVVRLMQDLEDDLASNDETLARHAGKLQNLDIAMQMLRAVAVELTPGAGDERKSIARLKDLRVSCDQALSAGK
jgi:hypothetical protein